MKILFWLSDFPKFSETFIRDQIIALIDRGHEILIFSEGGINHNEIYALQGFEDYHLIDKVYSYQSIKPKNRFLFWIKTILKLFTRKGKFVRKLLKYSLIKKDFKFKSNYLFILNFIQTHNIEVIHTHFATNAQKNIWTKIIEFPVKHIITFHGFDIRLGLKHGKAFYKKVFEYTDKVIAISDYNKAILLQLGLDSAKIAAINNGINTDFYQRETPYEIHRPIRMISVARLVEEKGLIYLIKSLQIAVKQNIIPKDFNLKIIGEGPLRNELEQLIAKLNLSKNIQLLGAQNSIQVRNLLITSDLYVLSSIAEALPTVLLEAQSCELPILATDVGAVNKMLPDAVIVKAKDAKTLADGFKKLFDRQNQWKNMGQQGRTFVLKHFDTKQIVKQLDNLYRNK